MAKKVVQTVAPEAKKGPKTRALSAAEIMKATRKRGNNGGMGPTGTGALPARVLRGFKGLSTLLGERFG